MGLQAVYRGFRVYGLNAQGSMLNSSHLPNGNVAPWAMLMSRKHAYDPHRHELSDPCTETCKRALNLFQKFQLMLLPPTFALNTRIGINIA